MQLRKVYDGDTLFTESGERVRVLGLNTPELEGPYTRAEPLGDAARRAAHSFLGNEHRIYLEMGTRTRDRHGRTLASVFRRDGRSLSQDLLQRGLGFFTAIPPDLHRLECLRAAEQQARRQGRGVWKHRHFAPRPARSITARDEGFRRIAGRVQKVSAGRSSWWLELDGPVVLLVPRKSMNYFPNGVTALAGKDIVVRGWLSNRSGSRAVKRGYKPMMLVLHHPAMLESPAL